MWREGQYRERDRAVAIQICESLREEVTYTYTHTITQIYREKDRERAGEDEGVAAKETGELVRERSCG